MAQMIKSMIFSKVYSNLFLPTLCHQILWFQEAFPWLWFFAPAMPSACKTHPWVLFWANSYSSFKIHITCLLLGEFYLLNTSSGAPLMSSHDTLYLFLSQHLSVDCHSLFACLLRAGSTRAEIFTSATLVLSTEL